MHHCLVQAYVDVMTYQQVLGSGAMQAAQHLLRQPSNVWRKGVVLVEVMNKAVLVSDGVPGAEFGLDAVCSGAFSRVEPPVALAGQVCILEAHGGPAAVNANDCTVLCRAHGRYFETQVRPFRLLYKVAAPSGSVHSSLAYGCRCLPLQEHVFHPCVDL